MTRTWRNIIWIGTLGALTWVAMVVATIPPGKAPVQGGAVAAPAAAQPVLASDDDAPVNGTVGLVPSVTTAPGPGYTREASRLLGLTPAGYRVWVDPRTPHHASIAIGAAHSVAELRALGLNVTWRGYGVPGAAEGVVKVTENSSGCQGGTNVVGTTWPYWMSLPNGDRYMYRAEISFCPNLFRYSQWQWSATIRHEIGHAMGLGHTDYAYLGSAQVMNSVTHYGVTAYRAGDRAGLRNMAANSGRIKSETAPLGRFEGSSFSSGKIVFKGWALLRYYRTHGVTITVTDNGRTVLRTGTAVLRADVNRKYDPGTRRHGYSLALPWNGGTHAYCVRATSTVNTVAAVKLGCVTWHG